MQEATALLDRYQVYDPRSVSTFVQEHPQLIDSIRHAENAIRSVFGDHVSEIALSVNQFEEKFLLIAIRTALDVDSAADLLGELDARWIDLDPLLDREDVLITVDPI